MKTPVPNKALFFRFCWWNGGGKIRSRLKTNPLLGKLLLKEPDVFIYGEAETPSPSNLNVNGYICHLHESRLNIEGNYRRGLAIFYLKKYRYVFNPVYSCRKYDIVWMRLKSAEISHFCFFYCPGAHHPLPIRSKFYSHLSQQFSKYSALGKVFLVGDTNARLGSVLNDRNLHGQLISNRNKPLFLEFLQHSGLTILNSIYCKGVATYEIPNKKRSIIDLCLTNSTESVQSFEIEPTPFGANCQTCHKALTTTLFLKPFQKVSISAPRRTRYGKTTSKKHSKIISEVTTKVSLLMSNGASPGYSQLISIFANAKRRILGIRPTDTQQKPSPLSSTMVLLQNKFSNAIKNLERNKSKFSLFIVENLEKLIDSHYKYEQNLKFSTWIKKMNDLDFHRRTRAFFSEIRKKQKVKEEIGPICDRDGNLSDNLNDTLKNWSEYYKNLYSDNSLTQIMPNFPTPDDDPLLDSDLTHSEFIEIIYSLKHHKSPGFDNILNEDITSTILEESEDDPVPPSQRIDLLKAIFKILSDFWFNECVPRDFKRTILRPFLKKSDALSYEPKNYRPISLLNTLMKVYEGIICQRLIFFLEENDILTPYQAAYREGKSTSDHILILHELFLEYRFNKKGLRGGNPRKYLYLGFLDLEKAFDTVPRNRLFSKVYNSGIRGKMFRVIKDLFSSNPANVLVDNFLSPEFLINRGVLQGSKLGPILFNLFINDLLEDLNNSGLGASIGPIMICALGFADDIVLISDSPEKLQRLLNICQSWALKNRMRFETSKCKVMILNGPARSARFKLNDQILDLVESYKYLGVTLTSKYLSNFFRLHFHKILERARIKVAIIKRHGFHEDGLRLQTAFNLYKLVIRPVLEYCAQALFYDRYSQPTELENSTGFAKELEQLQTQILKALINCPHSTSPAILRLFCGVEPLACRLEILKVRYYWRILKGPTNTITHKLLRYRKDNFLSFNKGFVHDTFNICCKYNMLNFWNGISPRNVNPLNSIKRKIISHNLRLDLETGRSKSCSFASIFLGNPFKYQKKYHLVDPFQQPDCFDSPDGRKRFIRALLHPCSYLQTCTHCKQQYRDKFDHFLTTCPAIFDLRKKLYLKLAFYNFPRDRIPPVKIDALNLALNNRILRKCLISFLVDSDF